MINTLDWVKITDGEHKGKKGVVLIDLGDKYHIRIVNKIDFLDHVVRYDEEIKKEYVEKIKKGSKEKCKI